MKAVLGFLLTIISISAFPQFPEPIGFDFIYHYFMIFEGGNCAGQPVVGPTYCSQFSWSAPDTSSTSATLEYYELHYYSYVTMDTVILTTTTEMSFAMEIAIIGEVWVTATYVDPDGGSGPSNIIINNSLPISVEESQSQKPLSVSYDNVSQELFITNTNALDRVNIYDDQGRLMISEGSSKDKLNIADLVKGIYVIELVLNNNETVRQKIIK
ncbi:MAG: T9SS type A sorting domain-containing protein [Flavobacteriales bacterium]|nr:T9SS type A sorting domain-containing protein [Flavobacteriales bacterium]MBK6944485.1 T9SS type A sorting domain-containing protein [Flavobacteriales bacterium]MBK7241354.1 T9SS type A sorting domain-containing protein [Flavobacteriales bacterium]MBK7298217.1 T9SS type A sorting domain-containing protein [Flavobacteriales bacterium]MBK9534152.1 T9SS type A sorting domain-containing protein [Flavobacteriales bacterium]